MIQTIRLRVNTKKKNTAKQLKNGISVSTMLQNCQKTINKWSKAQRHKEHCLPSPNEYIAANIQINSPSNSSKLNKYPSLIRVSIYFKEPK